MEIFLKNWDSLHARLDSHYKELQRKEVQNNLIIQKKII